jgi:hypothetical protein
LSVAFRFRRKLSELIFGPGTKPLLGDTELDFDPGSGWIYLKSRPMAAYFDVCTRTWLKTCGRFFLRLWPPD